MHWCSGSNISNNRHWLYTGEEKPGNMSPKVGLPRTIHDVAGSLVSRGWIILKVENTEKIRYTDKFTCECSIRTPVLLTGLETVTFYFPGASFMS